MTDNPDTPAMTPAERRRLFRAGARGYAFFPGTGPAGETCGTCAYHVNRGWHKCALRRVSWTSSVATDIRVGSPACAKWEARDDE
jgi:hypothetical protein